MAIYLRPRRGRRATAESLGLVLKKGEVFCEVPDAGTGKGAGKLKMGDGETTYDRLPYFLEPVTDVSDCEVTFVESTETNNNVLLNNMASGSTVSVLFGSLKKLLSNLNSSNTKVTNDLNGFRFGVDENGKCGYYRLDDPHTLIPF